MHAGGDQPLEVDVEFAHLFGEGGGVGQPDVVIADVEQHARQLLRRDHFHPVLDAPDIGVERGEAVGADRAEQFGVLEGNIDRPVGAARQSADAAALAQGAGGEVGVDPRQQVVNHHLVEVG